MPFTQWQAGQRITAGRLAAITPKWQSWTPAWTTSGTTVPSYGNATVECQYAQAGDAVWFNMNIIFGSTTNFGVAGNSDNWRFGLPVAAASTVQIVGTGEIHGVGGGPGRMGIRCRLTSTTFMELELSSGRVDGNQTNGSGLIDASTPWAWAATHAIRAIGHYPAA